MSVRYGDDVAADFAAIRSHGIDRWGVRRTLDFLAGFEEALQRLVEQPRMRRRRDDFGAGLRSVRFNPYQVFYLIVDEDVVIVAVIHERRNHSALDFADRMAGPRD